MAVTLEDLAERLAQLSAEVARLRLAMERHFLEANGSGSATRLILDAIADQAALSAAWDKAMDKMGIRGQPIGAKKVREMIAARGINPEDNEFSRGIIAMREE